MLILRRFCNGWNALLQRFGVCMGKDNGTSQTGRVIPACC